jgi:hypothetical protein
MTSVSLSKTVSGFSLMFSSVRHYFSEYLLLVLSAIKESALSEMVVMMDLSSTCMSDSSIRMQSAGILSPA